MAYTFSERLKELRLEKDMKQTEAAEILNVSVQSYSAYENGREPNYPTLIKAASMFDVTTDYLLGLSEYKTAQNTDICKRTGLSEKSIETLEYLNKCKTSSISFKVLDIFAERLKAIDFLISKEMDLNFFEHVAVYLWHEYEVKPSPDVQECHPVDKETENMMKCVKVIEKHSGINYSFDPDVLIEASLLQIQRILTLHRTEYLREKGEGDGNDNKTQ